MKTHLIFGGNDAPVEIGIVESLIREDGKEIKAVDIEYLVFEPCSDDDLYLLSQDLHNRTGIEGQLVTHLVMLDGQRVHLASLKICGPIQVLAAEVELRTRRNLDWTDSLPLYPLDTGNLHPPLYPYARNVAILTEPNNH